MSRWASACSIQQHVSERTAGASRALVAAVAVGPGGRRLPGRGTAMVGVDGRPILGALAGGVAWSLLFGRFLTPRPVDLEAAGTQADRLATPTPGGDPHHHGSDDDG